MRVAKPQVLVPWPECRTEAGLAVEVFPQSLDDHGQGDLELSGVELYVVPYGQPNAPDLITRLPALQAVQVLSAGYENVLDLLPDGVELYNGAGLHDASTAEHALGLILAAQRELPRWALDQNAGRWNPEYTRSLADSRVLIVGYGNIGRAIEARLLPFETTVTRVARRARPAQDVHGIDDLPALLPDADVVVLVLPQTPQTRGLIGARELALLPDDALIVNVGRGTALDTAALLAERGRVRAALDVVDPEPLPPGHPLWTAPGVFITPHIGGGSATFGPRARRFVTEQVHRWANGEPLLNRVDLGDQREQN
jgi:phosphoglycerate dehydrogenase-like enzyme